MLRWLSAIFRRLLAGALHFRSATGASPNTHTSAQQLRENRQLEDAQILVMMSAATRTCVRCHAKKIRVWHLAQRISMRVT